MAPPGAANKHNHFCFSDNSFQKQTAKEDLQYYRGTLVVIPQGCEVLSSRREGALHAPLKHHLFRTELGSNLIFFGSLG